jgi:FkbM family methyltransferase
MGRSRTNRIIPLWAAVTFSFISVSATAAVSFMVMQGELARQSLFSRPAMAEASELRAKYGPDKSSRNYEEWIIRDYFQDRRDGVFLDVGANHYRDENNTYFLETRLGWSGIAVEALEEFGPDYARHRPRTRYVAMFASDVADSTVQFFVADNRQHLVSSSTSEFVRAEGAKGAARTVPTTTLNAVLDQAGIGRLTFLSMDIELAEPKALAGFDIERFQPELVCIEAHADVRQQILDYFAEHDYVLVGKYLRMDPLNIYFRPRAHSGVSARPVS